MKQLANKTVIITGGGASIGAEISRELHRQGANIVIAARTEDKGVKLVNELKNNVIFIPTDISKDEDLKNLIAKTVDIFGGIDVLVNNACSYGDEGSVTDRETWLSTLNVNIVSAAILGELCRPHLAKNKGCIVNIGSISGNFPHTGRWAYPVSKAALAHLSKSQAIDYASDNIRVNLLRLGHIWSDPFDGLTKNDRAHANKSTAPYNLMNRVADGNEVAKVVAFVASADASYMTGGEIPVDGGYSAMGPEGHTPLFPILAK
jgi:NAD(P)-dependent dehydrogenase (short-subunit alcohol dehydrogenase family)